MALHESQQPSALKENDLSNPEIEATGFRMDTCATDGTMRIIFYKKDKKTGRETPLGVLPMDAPECYDFCSRGLRCYDLLEGLK